MSDSEEFKPNQGDTILVREASHKNWLERVFILKHRRTYLCEHVDHPELIVQWNQMRQMSRETRIPYTFETFPEGVVFINRKGWVRSKMITAVVSTHRLHCGDGSMFEMCNILTGDHQLSTDNCKTWQPASQLVEQTE